MAGGVEDGDRQRAEGERIALVVIVQAVNDALERIVVDAGAVRVKAVDIDRGRGIALVHGGCGERVVAMAVGEEDIAQRDTLALDEGGELVGGIGGVDERGLARGFVDEQVAVGAELADDGGDDFHKTDLRSVTWGLPDPSCPR